MDTLDARKPLDLNLVRISPDFLIDQIDFYHSSKNVSQYFITFFFNRS